MDDLDKEFYEIFHLEFGGIAGFGAGIRVLLQESNKLFAVVEFTCGHGSTFYADVEFADQRIAEDDLKKENWRQESYGAPDYGIEGDKTNAIMQEILTRYKSSDPFYGQYYKPEEQND